MAAASGLEEVRGRNGAAVQWVTRQYTYDTIFNRKTSETDEEGHTTYFILDSPAPLGFSLPAGVTVPQATGRTGNLLAIVDAAGNVTSYQYAGAADIAGGAFGPGDVKRIIDPRGRVTERLAYDRNGNLTLARDAAGTETTQVFDTRSRLLVRTDTTGRRTEYAYDMLDRVVHQEQFDDIYHSTGQRVDYDYLPGGQVRSVIDGLRQVTEYTYDELNRAVASIERGVIQSDGSSVDLFTENHYDQVGNLVRVRDARGVLQGYTYDALNRVRVTQILSGPSPTIVGLNNVIARSEYDLAGNKLFDIDLNGDRTDYVYDGAYRLVTTLLPFVNTFADVAAGVGRASVRTAYDLAGHTIRVTDANGNSAVYEHDAVYRVKRQIDAAGNTVEYVYDASGNPVKEVRTANGVVTSVITYDNGITIVDGLGRPSDIREQVFLGDPADAGTPTIVYSMHYEYLDAQNVIRVRDARGFWTEQRLDGLNRVHQQVVDSTGLHLTTTYGYDANGNQVTVIDPQNGDIDVSYTYDGVGRRIKAEYQLGLSETFVYDGVGNAVRAVDKRGIVFTTEYDNLNRSVRQSVREDLSNGGNLLTLTRRIYDDANHGFIDFDANANSVETHFDGLKRPVSVTDPYLHTVTKLYDAINLRAETDQNQQRTEYRYDSLNRLVEAREFDLANSLRSIRTTSYEDAHNRVVETDRLGVQTIKQMDSRGRVIAVSRAHPDLAAAYGSVVVLLEQSEYDGVGNLTAFRDAQGNATTYLYDGANRRTKQTDGFGSPVAATTTFTYDAVGHLLTSKDARQTGSAFDVKFIYDVRYRKLTETDAEGNTTSFLYDGNDNVVQTTEPLAGVHVTVFTYDELGKLLSVDQRRGGIGGTTYFRYDANRNQIARQDANGNLVTYVYDKLNRLTDTYQHLAPGAITAGTRRTEPVGGNVATALHAHSEYDAGATCNSSSIQMVSARS